MQNTNLESHSFYNIRKCSARFERVVTDINSGY